MTEAVPTVGIDPHLDRFIDALWLEDGLSRNTLAAYRRDLQGLATWLVLQRRGHTLVQANEVDLLEYALARHADSKPTSAGRRLSCFRRFYRWAVREGLASHDPTVRMDAPKQRVRVFRTPGHGEPPSCAGASAQDMVAPRCRPRRRPRRDGEVSQR